MKVVEVLTAAAGGAISVYRFPDVETFEAFAESHLVRLKSGPWATLQLVYLLHGEWREECLVVYGPKPELHTHGGPAQHRRVRQILSGYELKEEAESVHQKFSELRGRKGIAFMLKSLVDLDDEGPFDQEAEAFLCPVEVVIVVPPNAGKSTFFNSLLGEQRALVSGVEGTTRDLLQARCQIDGYEVHLVDTAGLELEAFSLDTDGGESIEEQSSRLSKWALRKADLILAFHWPEVVECFDPNRCLLIRSKSDDPNWKKGPGVELSIHRGQGMEEVMDWLKSKLRELKGQNPSPLRWCSI